MGQKNPVHIYKLVTEETIEERLLDTLASKQELADAALNADSDVSSVEMLSGIGDLKRRLEKILQPKLLPPVDESQQRHVEDQAAAIAERRQRVSAASGQLLSAALQMVGELVAGSNAAPPAAETVDQLTPDLSDCIERDEAGRPQLKISLPDDNALRSLAETLARLLK